MQNARAHVIISGRVQGVFFRAETQTAARNLSLTGWVRNRADGSVEALFEGPRDNVDRAIAWCRQGSAHGAGERG
jgi:acylphosphatase